MATLINVQAFLKKKYFHKVVILQLSYTREFYTFKNLLKILLKKYYKFILTLYITFHDLTPTT